MLKRILQRLFEKKGAMDEITVSQLKEMQETQKDFLLLDVRESFEYELTNIGGQLIPLDQLPDRIAEIEHFKEKDVIVMCRSGSRSARACEYLTRNGFTSVKNLKGGINDWAREIDPSLPVY